VRDVAGVGQPRLIPQSNAHCIRLTRMANARALQRKVSHRYNASTTKWW
jgi:hypothetical protein